MIVIERKTFLACDEEEIAAEFQQELLQPVHQPCDSERWFRFPAAREPQHLKMRAIQESAARLRGRSGWKNHPLLSEMDDHAITAPEAPTRGGIAPSAPAKAGSTFLNSPHL